MWSDRKSTRLNSSHVKISYAVFCLKKKKKTKNLTFTYKKKHETNKHKKLKHDSNYHHSTYYICCYSVCTHTTIILTYFFFFNDTATTEIYTLSLHDALPISSMFTRIDNDRSASDHR